MINNTILILKKFDYLNDRLFIHNIHNKHLIINIYLYSEIIFNNDKFIFHNFLLLNIHLFIFNNIIFIILIILLILYLISIHI